MTAETTDSERARFREALERISSMDKEGVRADDLGRAARIAHEAINGEGVLPPPDSAYWVNHDVSSPHFPEQRAEPQGLTDAEILEATFEVSHADITALSEYNIAICRALEAYLAARASAGRADK